MAAFSNIPFKFQRLVPASTDLPHIKKEPLTE
jgi:hypothetical protein